MKVNGSSGPSASRAAPSRSGGVQAGGGFRLDAGSAADSAAPAATAGRAAPVGSLEALLALQEVEGPLERRRRSVRRAHQILDALDELKLAVLDPAALQGPVLERLQRAVRQARGQTDDGRLDAVLEEVEVRAAVEMAKRELRPVA